MGKIGVFDSGIGGLTNLFSLIESHPAHYIYVADQKHNPYGEKTKAQLLDIASKVVRFLIEQGCNTIVIACNTVCANVLSELEEKFSDIHFVGVIKPTVALINNSKFDKILLLATPATITSGAYLKNNQKEIISLATPRFVPAIEQNNLAEIQASIQDYLSPFVGKVDAVCLGCTHYPIIENEIKTFLNIESLNSIDALSQHVDFTETQLKLEIYTTKDEVQLQNQIKQVFNRDIVVRKLEENHESYYIQ